MYRLVGDQYQEDLFYLKSDLDDGSIVIDEMTLGDVRLNTTEEDIGVLTYLVTGEAVTTQQDLDMLLQFREEVPSFGFTGQTPLSSARAYLRQWLSDREITELHYPLTYHAISVGAEALLTNQITRLREEGLDEGISFRSDNNTLCTVRGLFCSKTNAFVSKAAQTALAAGTKPLLKKTTNWSSGEINAVVIAIKLVLDTFMDSWFCKEECDDCGPAVGIRSVFNGCTFMGIEAVGTFEFAEEFVYRVDDNQDGVFDFNRQIFNSNPFLTKSSLPNTPFKVIVDVGCDGARVGAQGSTMPWPLGTQGRVYVDPTASVAPPRPTAIVNGPPLQGSPYPYYHNTNTQLCFSLSNLATRGWTFVGWKTTVSGGSASPSTGNSSSTFCTTFNSSTTAFASVYAEFSHPCSPNNYTIQAGSFPVCPPGACN
jgi:hypothetical protein